MTTKSKTKDFFAGNRRKAYLQQWTHLKTRAGESRVKMSITIPLLNESVVAMPQSVTEAFVPMAKDDSSIDRTNLTVFCEGMTLDIFSTDTSKRASVSLTGAKLDKLTVVSNGEGEKRTVDLQCIAYVPSNVNLRDWAWDHLHTNFYLEAAYSQTELDFDEDEEDEDSGEPAATGSKKKSGPKELLEFHEKQTASTKKK